MADYDKIDRIARALLAALKDKRQYRGGVNLKTLKDELINNRRDLSFALASDIARLSTRLDMSVDELNYLLGAPRKLTARSENRLKESIADLLSGKRDN